ncbi:MAG: tRNA (adenosine(37)-N6)-threonylcarbamoyltransferase complex transferase subunit TsaD [Verrucomicrobiae bacterium]|nr:tRNA (adenosine(37)-N6)-threonylcarbamoyltransferase complex transferase subunit TsaD [Verrucomicrobiae bacterium]
MIVLGIETSCDETAAAVVRHGREVLANIVSSQLDLHRAFGGVVPDLASRQHLQRIEPVIQQALETAGVSWDRIEAVAATYGPGLASSLLVGWNVGRGLALTLGVPFVAINHLQAHLYSPLIEHGDKALPMIGLVVSGGHTVLAEVAGIGDHRVLGQTRDDAAGEAFDKVARLLGLRYPGGPEIERHATSGNPHAVEFPRGLAHDDSLDFSFSGLKTAVRYWLEKNPIKTEAQRADICASFQEAVVDVLVSKTIRAAEQRGIRQVSISGGVSQNRRLRQRMAEECAARKWRLLTVPAALCTDNAAMIAALADRYLNSATHRVSDHAVEPSACLT